MGTSVFDRAWGGDTTPPQSVQGDALDAAWGSGGGINMRAQSESTRVTPRRAAPTQTSAASSALSGAAQGSTFGFADETLGGVGALNSLLPKAVGGEGAALSDFGKNYRRDRNKVRNFDRAATQEHPLAHGAGAIAGGVLPIIGTGGAVAATREAGLGRQLLNAAGQGAGYGFVQGAGNASDLSSTLPDALGGGAIGAATAPLLLLGGKGLGSAWRSLTGSQEEAAQDLLRQRIQNSGTTPTGVLDQLLNNTASSGEKPEMLGDYASEVAKLTKNVTKRPGAGRALVNTAIASRNAGAGERVARDLASSAPVGPRVPNAEELIQTRAMNAADNFPAAYNSGVAIDDPHLNELLQRPTFARAYRMAQTMAADEGRELPVNRETLQRLDPNFAAFLQSVPEEQRAAVQARALAQNPQLMHLEVRETPVPDVPTMAYIDRALRRLIDQGYEGGSPIVDPGHAHALQGAFTQFRNQLEALSPEYARAVDTFAGNSRSIDAAALGRRLSDAVQPTSTRATDLALGEGDPAALRTVTQGLPAVQEAVQGMTPLNAAIFRQEARGAATNALERVPATEEGSTTGAARQVFPNSIAGRRAQNLMFDTPEAAQTFQQALERERNMARTGSLMRGSDTIENAAENKDIAPKSVFSMVRHPVTAIGKGLEYLEERNARSLYESLAPMLAAQGPTELRGTLAQLIARPTPNPQVSAFGSLFRNLLAQQGADAGTSP